MPRNGESRSDNNTTNADAATNTAVSHQKSYLPIDFTTSSQISGEESQILEVHLCPNQILRAESGAMLYMTEGVNMETSMGLSGGSGGVSTGFTRMMAGQNLMVSDFQYTPKATEAENDNTYGTVALGTDFPAKILKFQMSDYPDAKLICQKGAFLAGSHSVQMDMAFTKTFSAGFFGGEGFVLQSLQGTLSASASGEGDTVFLKAYGTVVHKTLKENETLRISSGSLVAMTSTIDYDVTTLPGWKNVVFGGEGLFVTTLTGPGEVWLQGMPIDRMVGEIARKVPSGGIGLGIPIMGGGGGDGSADGGAVDGADTGETASEGVGDGVVESGVPVTDAAVEADRNATVASSGMESSDPDSPESLFGDAAYGGSDPNDIPDGSSLMDEESTFSGESEDFLQSEQNVPEFEEPDMTEQQFEEDETTFSSYEENGGNEGVETPSPEEGPSFFSQLWDFFTDDD